MSKTHKKKICPPESNTKSGGSSIIKGRGRPRNAIRKPAKKAKTAPTVKIPSPVSLINIPGLELDDVLNPELELPGQEQHSHKYSVDPNYRIGRGLQLHHVSGFGVAPAPVLRGGELKHHGVRIPQGCELALGVEHLELCEVFPDLAAERLSSNDTTSHFNDAAPPSTDWYPNRHPMERTNTWWYTNDMQNSQGGGQNHVAEEVGLLEEDCGEFEGMMKLMYCADAPGGWFPEEDC